MADDASTTLARTANAAALLVKAFQGGLTQELEWVDVTVDDLVVTVTADAMKGPLNELTGVRLPVSYAEAVTLCAALGCVSPTQKICDAMFAQAKAQLSAVTLVSTAADAAHINTVDFVLRFHERVEAEIAATNPSPGDLVFGAWKLWILHPRIVERGAINYGFWDKSHKPPKVIQTPGGQHDAAHYDYSQLFVPVKRMAKKVGSGEEVDLLDHIAETEKIPSKYIDPYKAGS